MNKRLQKVQIVVGIMGLVSTRRSHAWTTTTPTTSRHRQSFAPFRTRSSPLYLSTPSPSKQKQLDDDEDDSQWWEYDDLEVLQGDGPDFDEGDDDDEDEEWISDGEMARRNPKRKAAHLTPAAAVIQDVLKDQKEQQQNQKKSTNESPTKASPYTEEEEELIDALGGKQQQQKTSSKREDGYLGDCTLSDIAHDYSVPICYLADVLCMWGVPVPINPRDRLGDLVTGEQCFAIVEAIYSLDIGALNDRYSNMSIMQVCEYFEIDLKDAFEFAMKEDWSLPFGVQTNLRVEQEEELLRTFGAA